MRLELVHWGRLSMIAVTITWPCVTADHACKYAGLAPHQQCPFLCAEEVWALLERGGHVYVCGDAKHMARDVHRALIELIQRQAGCSGTQAETRLKQLADTGRYQRDVW